MGIIAKIGPLELSLILFFAVLFLYRIQAAPESRAATALVFIFSARFGASFVNGFSISEESKSSFGALDTAFAYLMLAFAFLEVLLLKHQTRWKNSDLWVLVGLLGLGFLNLTWKLTLKGSIISNDLLYVLPILLFLSLRPKKIDLRFLPYFAATIIIMVFISALAKYQNPLFPYFQTDYGLGGQYQNRLWGFFGWEERFRGPYFHPNQLGIQITFLSLLVILKPSKLYIAILPVSFTLLFLASSRTSILALTVGLLLRLYFDTSTAAKVRSSHMEQDLPKAHSRRRFTLRKIFIGLTSAFCVALVARQIIGSNTTGTGRLENNRNTISAIRSNLLLGQGPSIFSINSTENTILTILSFYGLIGLAFMLTTTFALTLKLRKMPHSQRSSVYIMIGTFLIATSGESLLTGTSQDTGLFYLLVLLALTRVEYSSKERLGSSA
jgi:hypothetical protein